MYGCSRPEYRNSQTDVMSVLSDGKRNVMILNLKRLFVFTVVFSAAYFSGSASNKQKSFNWAPVIEAIIEVESGGDARAVSGRSCGAMQITPILVKECNNILKKRGIAKRYTLADRFSVSKSKEMFLLMQSEFNPTNNVEKAIRTWNGGNNYKVSVTNGYYRKVMAAMKKK